MKDEGGREEGFGIGWQSLVTLQMPGPVVPAVLEAVGAALSIRRGTTTNGIAGCAVVVGHVGVPARQWLSKMSPAHSKATDPAHESVRIRNGRASSPAC